MADESLPPPAECGCCRAEGVELEAYPLSPGSPLDREAQENREPRTKYLCGLCASTMAGSWAEYPHHHDRDALEIMRAVCYVGNAVLRALAERDAS
jgi:hypothetical protein